MYLLKPWQNKKSQTFDGMLKNASSFFNLNGMLQKMQQETFLGLLFCQSYIFISPGKERRFWWCRSNQGHLRLQWYRSLSWFGSIIVRWSWIWIHLPTPGGSWQAGLCHLNLFLPQFRAYVFHHVNGIWAEILENKVIKKGQEPKTALEGKLRVL